MKICFIGKYPPIEGGVSTRNYWTAYALAQRGHEVSFVTNAGEVEDRFRIRLAADDAGWYEPRFERGFVRVVSSSTPEDKLAYIPSANPFVTKLASLATQTVREHGCEIVIASYFEPYAVAGYLATRFTGVPLVITHAGSDLGRLMKEPELATTYKEVLKAADCVLTGRRFRDRFAGFGVAPERVGVDAPFALATHVFNPSAQPLTEPGAYAVVTKHPDGTPASLENARTRPCIGIYGKIGAAKGSFDLVEALGALRREGVEFNLLAMTDGHDVLTRRFREALIAAGLADRTYLLPFVPNWRVPSFIRSCATVCFLERDFPIVSHGPIVAREVLACGVPLVLSREIANKQVFRDAIADGENVRLVEDPKDHAELAAVLRAMLADPARAAEIGANGRALSAAIEDSQRFVGHWDDVLTSVLLSRTSGSLLLSSSSPVATVRERLTEALPAYAGALGNAYDRIVTAFEDRGHAYAHGDRRIAMQFLQFVHDNRDELLAGCDPVLAETTEYLLLSLRMSGDPHDGSGTVAARESDRSLPGRLSFDAVAALRPTLRRSVVIGEFSQAAIGRASGAGDADGSAIVLFNRTPNLERCELRINEATRTLLALCDGTRSTQEIVAQLPAGAPATTLAALERFRTLGVIAFR